MVWLEKYFNFYTIIIIFFSTSIIYNFYNPLWTPPDEERHFRYCEHLMQKRQLPVYTSDPEQHSLSMGYQPPLYYLLGSFLCEKESSPLYETLTINDGPGYRIVIPSNKKNVFSFSGKNRSAYLIRLLSLVFCTAALYMLYLLGRKIEPAEPFFAVAVTMFVATIPQFQQIAVAVSNQSLMIFLTMALFFCLISYLENPKFLKWKIAVGLLLGLCLLTRTATILYIPIIISALIWVWFRDRQSQIRSAATIYGIAFLISGWWYLRNLILFKDPLFSKALIVQQPWIGQKVPLTINYLKTALSTTFTSFFGDLGSLQIGLPVLHLAAYSILIFLGLLGFFLWLAKDRKTLNTSQCQIIGLLLLAFTGGMVQYTSMNLSFFGVFMGRYLFIILAPISLIVFSGLRYLVPASQRNIFWVGFSALFLMFSLYFCYGVLRPAYANPLLNETAGQTSFCCETSPINKTTTISQRFISPTHNLCSIRVMFALKSFQQTGTVVFTLREEDRPDQLLHKTTYPLNKISDFQRLVFVFPPLENSIGKAYIFSLSSTEDTGISLWYSHEDLYPHGSVIKNGIVSNGDLYFNTYCFTGKTPKTVWQGKKAAVINQGDYIQIRELQLFLDENKTLQKNMVTSQKLDLYKTAQRIRTSKKPHPED